MSMRKERARQQRANEDYKADRGMSRSRRNALHERVGRTLRKWRNRRAIALIDSCVPGPTRTAIATP